MSDKWHIGLLLAVAVGVQVAFVLTVGEAPLTADGAEYVVVAKRLARGLDLTSPGGKFYVHSHPPLYPVFLGSIFKLGGDLSSVRWVQVLLSVATLVFVYAVARAELSGKAARYTLVLGALYLPAAFYSAQILTEAVFAFPLAVALYFLSRGWRSEAGARGWLAAAGVAFGVAALVRAIALPAAVAVGAYLLFSRGGTRRRRLAQAAVLCAGTAAVMAAWSGYVYYRTNHVVLIDTSGAAIFYIGNNPRTPYHHAWDALDDPLSSAPLREAVRPEEDGFRVAAEYRRAGLRYVVTHPFETVARFPGKLFDFVEPERLFAAYALRHDSGDGRSAWALPLAAAEMAVDAGLVLLWGLGLVMMPRTRLANVLRVLGGVAVAANVVAYGYPRYHVPLVFVSLAAAGYAAAEGVPALWRWRLARGRALGAAPARGWRALYFWRVPPRVLGAAGVVLLLLASWTRMAWLYFLQGR